MTKKTATATNNIATWKRQMLLSEADEAIRTLVRISEKFGVGAEVQPAIQQIRDEFKAMMEKAS